MTTTRSHARSRTTAGFLPAAGSLAAILLLGLSGCFESVDAPAAKPAANDPGAVSADPSVFTGDPSVSAELGGKGFDAPGGPAEKEGWLTSDPAPIGDPRAVKGGAITMEGYETASLRFYGQDSGNTFTSLLKSLTFMPLLQTQPNTAEHMPGLCTHWWIGPDKKTYRFRIDPRARWSDGEPVVAEDVLATYELIMNPEFLEANRKADFEQIEPPVALSKYVIEVRAKEPKWLIFYNVAELYPLPAHVIRKLTAKEVLEKYNFEYPPGNGPYEMRPGDVKTGEHVVLTRVKDHWAGHRKAYQGMYNFDRIRFLIIDNPRLSFDRIIKGEQDYHENRASKWWIEETDTEATQKGWLVKQKVWNHEPQGFQGHLVNLRLPLFSDLQVRRALALLYDRDKMLKEFAYNLYEPLHTYFPGSAYANPSNERVVFNAEEAKKLLDAAGWDEVGGDGIRVKGGKRLSFTLQYRDKFFEKYVTTYKEACRAAGVEVLLKENDGALHFKNLDDFAFEMSTISWSAGLFPQPRQMWHSSLANAKNSFNFTGFKNARADEIIDAYELEFDLAKRQELIRELDGIIYKDFPYILEWYNASHRLLYWNRFGMPESVYSRYGDEYDALSLWWVDPEKDQRLKAAKMSGEFLPKPSAEVRFWDQAPGGTPPVGAP